MTCDAHWEHTSTSDNVGVVVNRLRHGPEKAKKLLRQSAWNGYQMAFVVVKSHCTTFQLEDINLTSRQQTCELVEAANI